MRGGGILSDPQEMTPLALPRLSRSGTLSDKLAALLIRGSAFVAILSLVLIFIFIGKEALPLLTSSAVHKEADLARLFLPQPPHPGAPGEFAWQPISQVPKYSLLPLFAGTLKVTVIAVIIAIPLSVAAAVFTSEFAPSWVRETIKPCIEILAGIPSVVVGFFCLMVIAGWLQSAFGWTYRLNALTAGVGLSLAVIPIVYTVAEDAFSSVPQSYREGSIAMGASSWQTASRVVLPAAMPGVLAACVLGFGRAIGETMIVLMASGNAAVLSWSPVASVRTFSATIAAELGEVVVGSPHYHVLFFLGAFLFILTFILNLLGRWWVSRLQKKLQGAL
jgi:phosphate transport system permease protein